MMIIHNEDQFESRMIADSDSIIKEDEINDVSSKRSSTDELLKSSNKRKQIKPNRVSNDTNDGQINSSDSTKQNEAYCSLCERSFCNKYFLKTHFAKKHGVLNVSSPSSSPPSPADQSSSQISDPKLSEDYCEICQKRFCNKYYLRKHKGECHGIYTDYIKSLQKSPVKSPTGRLSSINSFYLPNNQSSEKTTRRCQYCPEEFQTRSLLRLHIATEHGQDVSNKSDVSPTNKLGFLQPYVDTSSPLAHKLVAGQSIPSTYGILHDSYFCAKMADRVVCEICNKQVCNKYFLKTHKAKVHGITSNGSSDNFPPTMVPQNETLNDEQDENSCSLCQKDFPNKYLYLLHMQTVHNDSTEFNIQSLMELMKAASTFQMSLNKNESDDESDGVNADRNKRKRSSSQTSNESNKRRLNSTDNNNAGLQPFFIESEDSEFGQTFVPCMVYLPVLKRVTQQVQFNLRFKPVLTPDPTLS